MTAAAFQHLQTAMVLDSEHATRIAAKDFGDLAASLTDAERERLVAQATDPGMALTRKLHQGWRLTKLLTLLPMTFRFGDAGTLSDLVAEFWRAHQPQGLYFESEALRFATMVARWVPAGSLLQEVATFEAAMLSVDDRAGDGGPVSLHLSHDPREWLRGRTGSGDGSAYDVVVARGAEQAEVRVTPCSGECQSG